ncbi:MAG: HAMP domain-containing sensor histidine kinase [Eubacteriales bacterium]|nr:HAMP domain-containing sensor histidine kinase [Eubacteriales bacterium]
MRKTEKTAERFPDSRQGRRTLRWKLTGFVFSVIVMSFALVAAVYGIVLTVFGSSEVGARLAVSPVFLSLLMLGACTLIAMLLFVLLNKCYLQPLKRLIRATKEIGEGHFDIYVEEEKRSFYQVVPELQLLIRNFNEMAQELRGIELFRNEFINNYSHEFKTPIISIRGFAHELRQEGLTDEMRAEYARIIEEESDRLARLSSNVLTLSKLENQQIVTGQTDFYLDEQIRQCILTLESDWTSKELEIIPELEPLLYHGNEEMLALIWRNLLGNAIKFTPQGGCIRITMQISPHDVTVAVADNGIGMSREVMARIFEKFYQGDLSHAHAGYGIGLSLVGRVIHLVGGKIFVDSEESKGSTFTVILPR